MASIATTNPVLQFNPYKHGQNLKIIKATNFHVVILLIFSLFMSATSISDTPIINTVSGDMIPQPKEWPEKMHALLVMNDTEAHILQVNNLWYDWKKGLNVQLIQYQQGKLLHAISWSNGTSFYFTLEGELQCVARDFGVGILRPDWLRGAHFLGQTYIDGFLCNLWEKVEFIWYYEEVLTQRPIHWDFYNGIYVNVITFEGVDNFPEESEWQAPYYCFDNKTQTSSNSHLLALGLPHSLLRTSLPVSLV